MYAFPTLFWGRSNVAQDKVKTSFQSLKVAWIIFVLFVKKMQGVVIYFLSHTKYKIYDINVYKFEFCVWGWYVSSAKLIGMCLKTTSQISYFALNRSAEINLKPCHKAEWDGVNKWFGASLTWMSVSASNYHTLDRGIFIELSDKNTFSSLFLNMICCFMQCHFTSVTFFHYF